MNPAKAFFVNCSSFLFGFFGFELAENENIETEVGGGLTGLTTSSLTSIGVVSMMTSSTTIWKCKFSLGHPLMTSRNF